MTSGLFNLAPYKTVIEDYFASLHEIELAYLFGSQVRGQAGPLSDVDVAILLADTIDDDTAFDLRLRVIQGLMELLHANEIDVIILNQAPPALRYRVLYDGTLLYCRDRRTMIKFYARTVSEYLDLKPMLERHERAILERARRGELCRGYNPYRGTLEHYRQLRERLKGTAGPDV